MEDFRLALITGVDIAVPKCQLVIHQPKLKEIALLGETDFFIGVQCLNINKNMYNGEDETLLQNLSNFQIFMKVINDQRAQDKKENVYQVLSLLLPNKQIVFLPNSLIFNSEGKSFSIDENNFDIFQNIIQEIFCLKSSFANTGFNPGGRKAKDIADKLMKARQRVAQEKGEENLSILSTYMSSLSVGLQISLTDVAEYTLYQLYDAMERYGLYLAWDIDIKSRLAGGKPEEKQENWMKNIH